MLIPIYSVIILKNNDIYNSLFSSLEQAQEYANNRKEDKPMVFTNYIRDHDLLPNSKNFFDTCSIESLIEYRNALLDAEMCLDKYLDDNKLYNFNHVKDDKDNSKNK